MDDIEELYHLFPSIKNDIKVIKKVGQGILLEKNNIFLSATFFF